MGYEKEVQRDMALGVHLIYRKSRNLIEDREINFSWDGLGGTDGRGHFINDGGFDGSGDFAYELRNIDGETNYKALEWTFRKNFSNNWQMLASYVLSKAEGDVMGDFTGSSGYAMAWNTPSLVENQYGLLNHDRRHVVKLSGIYFFPHGINAGTVYSFQTGMPCNHYFWHDGYGFFGRLLEPRGRFHYPNRHQVDVRAEKTFQLPWGRLGLLIDIFNLFNDGAIIRVREYGEYLDGQIDDWSRFQEVLGRAAPRRIQMGVRFTF